MMQLRKELFTKAEYLHFPSNEHINMFSSVFYFQTFLKVFLGKGPVPEKGKVVSNTTEPNLLTFTFYVKKYGYYMYISSN